MCKCNALGVAVRGDELKSWDENCIRSTLLASTSPCPEHPTFQIKFKPAVSMIQVKDTLIFVFLREACFSFDLEPWFDVAVLLILLR